MGFNVRSALFTVLPSESFDHPVAAHQGLVELLRQVVHVDPPLVAFLGFSPLPLLPPLGINMPVRGNIIPL